MRRAVGVALLGFAGLVGACDREGEPRPQWIVHVGTDAPLPGFGDRIRIDVVDADGSTCSECVRVLDLRGGKELPLSLGVLPRGKEDRWLRARLFRAEATSPSGDPTEPLIDVLGRLPSLGSGPVDVQVVLTIDCFGTPASAADKQSCDPATGSVTTSFTFAEGGPEGLPAPGSWGGGAEPCPSDPPPGMICVPGAVFLLGSRVYRPFGAEFDPVPEQLVRVSPFHIDLDELTVAAYRPLVVGGVPEPRPRSIDNPHCAYTSEPGDNDAASVNCLTRSAAALACEALGKRLPTEAEWEFAAGGATLESAYPWPLIEVTNEALCAQAVLARAEPVPADPFEGTSSSRLCIATDTELEVGPQPGGTSSDVNFLGLRNMGGNLAEWVADDYARYDDAACWGADLALRDNPRCDFPGPRGVTRGGDWESFPYNAHPFFRRPVSDATQHPTIGLRCAMSIE